MDAASIASVVGHGSPDPWADLWLGRPEDSGAPARERLFALLDDGERERARRFVDERARASFTFAHALVRLTLARYLGADPRTLRFAVSAQGRPELATLAGPPPLRFNLSHTSGLVACIVTATGDCGVDVESLGRRVDYPALIPEVLASSEAAALRTLSDERRRDRFLQIWTLKEAYIKGRGLGLLLPLREIAFTDFDTEPGCTLGPSVGDDRRAWRFWSSRPSALHRAAVALRTGGGRATLSVLELDTRLCAFRVASIVGF